MQDTKAILEIAYPEVEQKLKANMASYKRYISQFINKRSVQLYANAPLTQIYFKESDVEDFFKSTEIDINVIKNAISKTYYYEIANFNPRYAKDECTIAMLCIVRYFRQKNMKKELDLALINIAFSGKFYSSVWSEFFPKTAPNEHVMNYVITNVLSNKFDIVREGNVIGAVKSISNTWCTTYNQQFKDFHDEDCKHIIQQLRNRIKSFMNNIASVYYEYNANKDLYITFDSEDVGTDNYRLTDSDSLKLSRTVENTMTYINTHGIDVRNCKISTGNDGLIKYDELKSILENLINNTSNTMLIKELVTLMVVCYFQQSKKKDVRDLEFISYCIKSKPNSKDKYINKQKEIVELILINNSDNFARRRNRKATEAAYYRAINSYFALTIQKANS